MPVVLFFFLIGTAGPMLDGDMFETKAECEKAAKVVVQKITDYNSSTENTEKIAGYAVACVPLKDAPEGAKI